MKLKCFYSVNKKLNVLSNFLFDFSIAKVFFFLMEILKIGLFHNFFECVILNLAFEIRKSHPLLQWILMVKYACF